MMNKDKKIIKEDIQQLKELAEYYKKNNKITKAEECLKEAEELKEKLQNKDLKQFNEYWGLK